MYTLACGFQKASLHKIAQKAGVTTGAIYTRYKNKDELFISLLQDFFKTMEEIFSPAAEEYERAKKSALTEDIIRAINVEEGIYFRLLTEHYDECTLFFSRSDGSSAETMLKELMDRKTRQTIDFFSEVYGIGFLGRCRDLSPHIVRSARRPNGYEKSTVQIVHDALILLIFRLVFYDFKIIG